jgi:hypothetical protein
LIQHSLIFAFLGVGAAQAWAQLFLVRGLPLEATRTRTANSESDKYATAGRVARSSNGSTYQENIDPETGEVTFIHIIYAVGQRAIYLDVKRKFYGTQPMPDLKVGNAPSSEDLQSILNCSKRRSPLINQTMARRSKRLPLAFEHRMAFWSMDDARYTTNCRLRVY